MMKKLLLLVLLVSATVTAFGQSTRKLRSFFTERYVQNYFYYAHPNAAEFNGIEIKRIDSDQVVVKASFESDGFLSALFGGTYICTITIDVAGYGHFTKVSPRCESGSSRYPCFEYAADEIRKKCRDANRNRRSIDFMEDHLDKRLSSFTGEEAMCTLLNIALYNYDY